MSVNILVFTSQPYSHDKGRGNITAAVIICLQLADNVTEVAEMSHDFVQALPWVCYFSSGELCSESTPRVSHRTDKTFEHLLVDRATKMHTYHMHKVTASPVRRPAAPLSKVATYKLWTTEEVISATEPLKRLEVGKRLLKHMPARTTPPMNTSHLSSYACLASKAGTSCTSCGKHG